MSITHITPTEQAQAPATPATPTPPAPLPPPGQRGSVVMFTHPADADADADTGPALAGAWAREVTAAGLALAVVTVGTLGLSAGLAWAMFTLAPMVLL